MRSIRVGELVLATLLTLSGGRTMAASTPADTVILQGLDKITALPTGASMVVTRAAAFLEIVDAKPGEAPVKLFSGWMFASSPAVSALEHPVYDVWVIDCKNAATSGAATSP